MAKAREYIGMRSTEVKNIWLIDKIRRIMPDFGVKGEVVDLEEEEEKLDAGAHGEIVDLEEEEKRPGTEPPGA